RRTAVFPHGGRRQFLEQAAATARCDERQLANRRGPVPGRLDEPRVLVVGDWKSGDEEFAHVDAMDGTLVVLGVRGAHQKVTGRNPGEIGWRCERHRLATATWCRPPVSTCQQRCQYSLRLAGGLRL